ncbi:MAG TPA: hypothetical protein VIK31_03330 [Propionibacteriaceae bacterium]
MITDVFPVGVMSPGNNLAVAVPTLTTPTAPKMADIAATALDMTDYIMADGWAMKFDQARDDDTRLSDSSKRETFGIATIAMEEISYIFNPQGTGTETGNKMPSVLIPDTSIYIVIRLGKARATALAIADIVDVYAVQLGKSAQFPQPAGKYLRTIKTSFTKVANAIALVA